MSHRRLDTQPSGPALDLLLAEVAAEVAAVVGQGAVADYIEPLAQVSADRFGMAVVTLDGSLAAVGDSATRFSIQSISKLFTAALAISLEGDRLWRRVGREPSGNAFNSLVQLEHEEGVPRNPFLNAGALVIADVLLGHEVDSARIAGLLGRLAGVELAVDPVIARAELATGYRNQALAAFLKSFGNLNHSVERVLELYTEHCAIPMSCRELAQAGLFLANGGLVPTTGERILGPSQTKRLNALMLTCGTYDAVGDFAYRVGLPGKSGVGGGILAVLPGMLSVCVWSPGLGPSGNSLAGTLALELFTTKLGLSIF